MDSYLDLVIKRQVLLERLKSGQVRDFNTELKKIERSIREILLGIEDELGSLSRNQFQSLLREIQTDQELVFGNAAKSLLSQASNIAVLYMTHEVVDLEKTVDLRRLSLKKISKKKLLERVLQRPLSTDGDLLEPWISEMTRREVSRVSNVVRRGWSQGKTNQEMVREIIGTKKLNYNDGILQTTRRNASTIVRTSIQHVASAARQEVWEENRKVISKYEYLATLDRLTSTQCRSLDGQQFEFGKGPIPPIHPNCRSTTIPILNDEFSFLSKGRTRSSEDGPVSSKQSYYDWLNRQPKEVQEQALGISRAKLFRDGGMSLERFRELQFDRNFEPLTLKEMQSIAPEAFSRAGLNPNKI